MSDIKSKLVNLTGNLAKTSGSFVKSAKLNIELASQEENLKSIYIDIGKKVHEIYMFGGSLGKVFDEKYKEIVLAEAKVKETKDMIDILKGVKTCEKCGKGVERNAEFCPFCGNKMFGGLTSEESVKPYNADVGAAPDIDAKFTEVNDVPVNTPNVEEQTEYKTCPACGSKNDVKARFCLSCGRII